MSTDNRVRKIGRIFRRVLFGFIALFFILTTVLVVSAFNDLPPLGEIENPQMDLSTQILSADGKLIGSFHDAENRIYVKLEEISPFVLDALIATEDIRFRDHCGIDPKTIPSMMYRNLIKRQRSGGSSITQQLARNLYDQVGRSKTFIRKIKEAIVAVILESRFTKDEIMQAYLNTASFYGNTFGIEMGSRTLFGKSAKELEPHEAALMVGLLKGPSYYNPRRHPERALDRRNTVISQMEKYGYIEAKEARQLKKKPLDLNYSPGGSKDLMARYFKEHVRQFLKDWVQTQDKDIDLYADGLKVYTTLDSRMQRYAERAVKEHLSELQQTFRKELKRTGLPWRKDKTILDRALEQTPRHRKAVDAGLSKKEIREQFAEELPMRIWTWEGERDTVMTPLDSVIHYMTYLQTGFMSMDPRSGEIKAWVGGINYGHFQFDHVYQGKRQVGSTFKPFVYTAAMERGFTPCQTVLDIPVSITLPDGKVWSPKNSGGTDDGLTNYMTGLAKSKNQVTATLMKKIGPAKVCEYARAMGITSDLDCVPSLCLGTSDLSVYEMVGAYSTFANQGVYSKPYFITRIEDKYGHILYSGMPEQREAIDSVTAFTMVNMLMGVVDHLKGTAHRLRHKYKFTNQIAGKTGTTQNNSDGWFIGVTPNLVSGAWVGCEDKSVRFRSTRYGQGANMALPIWAIYMKYVYADKNIGLPQEPFHRPEGYHVKLNCSEPKVKTPELTQDSLPEELWDSDY